MMTKTKRPFERSVRCGYVFVVSYIIVILFCNSISIVYTLPTDSLDDTNNNRIKSSRIEESRSKRQNDYYSIKDIMKQSETKRRRTVEKTKDPFEMLGGTLRGKLYRVRNATTSNNNTTTDGTSTGIIEDQYIIGFNDSIVDSIYDAYNRLHQIGTKLIKPYHSMLACTIQLQPELLNATMSVANKRLQLLLPFLESNLVLYVEEDQVTKLYISNDAPDEPTVNASSTSSKLATTATTTTSTTSDVMRKSSNDGITTTTSTSSINSTNSKYVNNGNNNTSSVNTTSSTANTSNSNNNATTSNNGKTNHSTTTLTVINDEYPVWGLDRIDQTNLPLNNLYHADTFGTNVYVYIIDTGILSSHEEFQKSPSSSTTNSTTTGRATCAYNAINFTIFEDTSDIFDDHSSNEDCTDRHGHGTHIAGIVGGNKYGVAKNVNLIGIKAISDKGLGSISSFLNSIDYVLNIKFKNTTKNMIVVLSSISNTIESVSLNMAIGTLIEAGISVILPAGDSNIDACSTTITTSPTATVTSGALIVAATDSNDFRSNFSNYGTCIDLFAPGSDIQSAWITTNTSTKTLSGTAISSAYVAGVVALYLSSLGSSNDISPAKLATILLSQATSGVVSDTQDSPNVLLNSEQLFTTTPIPPPIELSAGFSINSIDKYSRILRCAIPGLVINSILLGLMLAIPLLDIGE